MTKYSTLTDEMGEWGLEIPKTKLEATDYNVDLIISNDGHVVASQQVKCTDEVVDVPETVAKNTVVLDGSELQKTLNLLPVVANIDEFRFSAIPPEEASNYAGVDGYTPNKVDVGAEGKILLTPYYNANERTKILIVVAPVDNSSYMTVDDCHAMLSVLTALTKVSMDGLDLSETSVLDSMFARCPKLRELDLSDKVFKGHYEGDEWIIDASFVGIFNSCHDLTVTVKNETTKQAILKDNPNLDETISIIVKQ